MDAQSSPVSPKPDWYTDPCGRHQYRFWDGAAWSDHVADAGAESIDPIEAQPAAAQVPAAEPVTQPDMEPAASPDESPAAAKPAMSRGAKTALIAGLAAVVVIVLASAGYSMAQTSLAAKGAAAASIGSARKAIAAAQLAVESGSPEVAQSQKSKAQLAAANQLYAQGSVFSAGPYRSAKVRADQARAYAQSITKRVADMQKDAAATSANDANAGIAIYFALAKQFPRTPEGQAAVDKAANVLLGTTGNSDISTLESIKHFSETCPGEVPASLNDAAATSIASLAESSLGGQQAVVSSNRRWVKGIKGKGVSFTVAGTSGTDTSDLSEVIAMLPTVQATRYRGALTLLRDSSKLGEKCGAISRSPVRRSGTTRFFSMSQVNQVNSLTKAMAAKLARASQLLNNL